MAMEGQSSRPIDYRLGDAEHTGLPDQSVDLVLCAQSFHWFNAEAALGEFHRILRENGRLALLWNVRDGSDAFSAGYELNSQHAEDAAERDGRVVRRQRAADPTIGGFFGNVRSFAFANPQPMTLEELLGRARSASYFPRTGALRAELEQELRDLFNRFAVNGMVTLQQRSELTLANRRPRRDSAGVS
jgi:ubiquinone/menaquinone biosynthesis C-methylase UbiE